MGRLKIYLFIVALLPFLFGCKPDGVLEEPGQSKEFEELVRAYETGKVFSSVDRYEGACQLNFTDGSYLVITEFEVHDCTVSKPVPVTMNGQWWSVGGITQAVKVQSGVPSSKARPVYVYYDKLSLYVHVSNGEFLEFGSVPLENQKPEGEDKEQVEGGDNGMTGGGGGHDEGDGSDDDEVLSQNIPVVRITTAGGAGIYDKKNYVDGTITITDPEMIYSDVAEFTADMGIRGRGNSTWSFPKKPWKVKLDEKASLLGMPADKEWALLANYADRTLLRNIVAMKLSEICGFSWTPRMRSVEVYLNDEYQGVYTLCEHKKVSADRVNIDIVGENDNEGEAVTGGYYLEIEEQQDETTCWWTDMRIPMMFSDPEEPTSAQYEYVTGLFAEFEEVLQSDDFADPAIGYAAYIDVDSFIDYFIVQELTKNPDGNLRKSSFITKERGKKMEMYHLWDFDLTLGNCGYFPHAVGNGPEGFWVRDYGHGDTYKAGWFYRLFQDPAFVAAVKTRWNELLPELEKIPEFIDEQAFIIEPARERNFEVWDINESVFWVFFPSLGSYEAELDYLKEFYTDRLQWLTTELKRL